jgi:hypothetical protein
MTDKERTLTISWEDPRQLAAAKPIPTPISTSQTQRLRSLLEEVSTTPR